MLLRIDGERGAIGLDGLFVASELGQDDAEIGPRRDVRRLRLQQLAVGGRGAFAIAGLLQRDGARVGVAGGGACPPAASIAARSTAAPITLPS